MRRGFSLRTKGKREDYAQRFLSNLPKNEGGLCAEVSLSNLRVLRGVCRWEPSLYASLCVYNR